MGHYAYFDKVSSLLQDLTKSWSITLEFANHFPDSTELQAFLAEYLTCVVQLCQRILVVAKRPSYVLLAGSILSTFDTEFKPIQDELNAWGRLIEKKFASLANTAAQEQQAATKETNSLIRLFFDKKKERDIKGEKRALLNRLSPQQDQITKILRRERKRGTTSWILDTSEYKSWKTGTQSVLRVTGHLGCGKTVALANIIVDITTTDNKCAGFICKRDDPTTLEGRTILGSIARQLVQSSTDPKDWEAVLDQNPDIFEGSMTTSSIVQFLLKFLPPNKTFHIVLDGLQDCAKQEVEVVLEGLSDLRKSHPVSVCFSTTLDGLPVGLTEQYLGTANVLSLNTFERDAEIKDYIKKEVQRRNAVRQPPLDTELEGLVIEQLTLGAQGM